MKLAHCSGPALFAEAMQVEQDVLLGGGFEADGSGEDGAVCLTGARIGGRLDLTGAQLRSRGDEQGGQVALNAGRLAVGGDILGNSVTCQGKVCLDNAEVAGSIHLKEAWLSDSAEWQLTCQHLKAHEVVLLTSEPIKGVDLRHARIDLLRDDPEKLPERLRLDGLTYSALEPPGTSKQRQGWLDLDPCGYRPQPYEQLASWYRQLGNDSEARKVLLAKQRRRRRGLGPIPKAWGYLQDFMVGYGYVPWFAVLWLIALLAVGTLAFSIQHPAPVHDPHPAFVPLIYTLDLLLPVIDFGQRNQFNPHGAWAWLAYGLIAAGWILATTVAAGITRALRRQ
jgi:hypothetical protein